GKSRAHAGGSDEGGDLALKAHQALLAAARLNAHSGTRIPGALPPDPRDFRRHGSGVRWNEDQIVSANPGRPARGGHRRAGKNKTPRLGIPSGAGATSGMLVLARSVFYRQRGAAETSPLLEPRRVSGWPATAGQCRQLSAILPSAAMSLKILVSNP